MSNLPEYDEYDKDDKDDNDPAYRKFTRSAQLLRELGISTYPTSLIELLTDEKRLKEVVAYLNNKAFW